MQQAEPEIWICTLMNMLPICIREAATLEQWQQFLSVHWTDILHFFTPNSCLCILVCKNLQRFGFVSTIVSCDEPVEVLWASAAFSCSFLTLLSWLPWNQLKTDNDLSLDADQRWSPSVARAQMGGFPDSLALKPIWTRIKRRAVLESQSGFLPYRSCAAVGGATSICPEIQRKSSIDKRSKILVWSWPCAFYKEFERKDGLIMS